MHAFSLTEGTIIFLEGAGNEKEEKIVCIQKNGQPEDADTKKN